MKYLFVIAALCLFFTSCQKDVHQAKTNLYPHLRESLRKQLPDEFNRLDFNRVTQTKSNGSILIRVAFKGVKMSESFVLAKVDAMGDVLDGRIISLGNSESPFNYTGTIRVNSLTRQELQLLDFKDGYRVSAQPAISVQLAQPSMPDPYITLPEVIVVGSYPAGGGGMSYGTWISLISLIDGYGGGGGNWMGGYSPADPYGGGGGGGGGYGGGGTGAGNGGGDPNSPSDPNDPNAPVEVVEEPIFYVEFESQYADPAIDIEAYLKCFSQIPDAGAVCTIGIYSDLPVDGDPSKLFNFMNGSPGHAFIKIEKQNGGQAVKQYMGMYPAESWKTDDVLNNTPGKLVDNKNHEYNAYMEINITPAQLQQAIEKIRTHKNVQYNLNHYNCTDFALQIWNAASTEQTYLEIPKLHIPGSTYPASNTPQGLYMQIQGLKESGNPLASASQVNVEGISGISKGPCN